MVDFSGRGLACCNNYIKQHWLGLQSLGWSLCVNFIALRLFVFVVQEYVQSSDLVNVDVASVLALLWVLAAHLVLLIWQIVGVWRAAERHFSHHGTVAVLWSVELLCVLLFLHTVLFAFDAYLAVQPVSDNQARWDEMVQQRRDQYRIYVGERGEVLYIDGVIDLGLAKLVADSLHMQPRIHEVHLHSDGGNIYEARALAKLFSQFSLATHVEHSCASACAIAFLGGLRRSVAAQGRLGFHQYRVDADYTVLATDTKTEQARDATFFLASGISPEFVDTAFTHTADRMWWPDHAELISAGVVHTQR